MGQADFPGGGGAVRGPVPGKGAVSIINDNMEIAAQTGADGVHVGQEDLEAGRARGAAGAGQADRRFRPLRGRGPGRPGGGGADYLGVGAAFVTGTKTDAKPISRETIRAITAAVDIPVVANRRHQP